MKEDKKADFLLFSDSLPTLLNRDINNNILMFIFMSMFKASKDEQKDAIVGFVDQISSDIGSFFLDKAKAEFDLTEEESNNLNRKIKLHLNQNLGPILKEIQEYKNDKK